MMKTALYDRHVALGGKMVSFSDWEMPIQYQGILAEHQAVRERVGLFDVSHMGRIHVRGPDAERCLDELSTNNIRGKASGLATYTVWCHPHGGSVDDMIVYKLGEDDFFIVANAGNRNKDLNHLVQYARQQQFDVEIQPMFEGDGILALQGPLAQPLLSGLIPEVALLKSMHVISLSGGNLYLSRSGYTGAGGFEIFGEAEEIASWWDLLIAEGVKFGIQPIGLGARDTLRLEMGYALYGHELSDEIAPIESVSAWTVKRDKIFFVGKEALEQLEGRFDKRRAYGVVLKDQGIPRQGYPIFKDGVSIGEVTSGSFSPTLRQGIALIIVNSPLQIGERVDIQIRQHFCFAEVCPLPFLKK